MPTDTAVETIEIDAPYDAVLAVIRDVESQPLWVPAVVAVQVVEKDEDGLPAVAEVRATTPVGKDEYRLAYRQHDDGMSWGLVSGRLQSQQDARYRLRRVGRRRTAVTFELVISHGLPLPGFVRRRVITGLVRDTLSGLKGYLEV
jgi:uncharacterized membrane protein